MYDIEETGGARIGKMNATWPFAKLLVNKNELTLNTSITGDLVFVPSDIISIEPYTLIPGLGRGIRICHNVKSYNEKVIFWTTGSPEILIMRIIQTGFIANNTSFTPGEIKERLETVRLKSGFPVKTSSAIVLVVIWNLLFLHDEFGFITGKTSEPQFDIGVQLALGVVFLTGLMTLVSVSFRNLILKDGRDIEEIRRFLYLMMFGSGFGFLVISFM